MAEQYETIQSWAPIVGRWRFPSPLEAVYMSPQHKNNPLGILNPFGVCVSNIRFSEGDAKVTIQLPKDLSTMDAGGRILLGYRSIADPYILVGLGGWGSAYSILQFDRVQGWRALALSGSQDNLAANHPYPNQGSCSRTEIILGGR